MSDNKNTNIKKRRAGKAPKVSRNLGRGLRNLLGGEMLQSGTFRFFPFLVFIAFLAFVYIANNYYAEDKIRSINQLRKELKEIRYEYITTKSELTNMTKQSQLAKTLEKKGIKESTDPIKIIQINDEQND